MVKEHLYRSLHDIYPVVEHSRLIGSISSKQIVEIPREEWTRLTVRDVAAPCSKDITVGIDTGALTTLSIMNRTGNSRLLVMDADRLVGIVTLKDLLRFLALKWDIEGVR